MSTLIITNNTDSGVSIADLRSFEVVASGTETLSDYFTQVEMSNSDNLISLVSDGTFTVNNGIEDLTPAKGAKYCLGRFFDVDLADEYRDRSGKLRVHQTSRKLGLRVCWTGVGDNPADPHSVGGGSPLTVYHIIGGTASYSRCIDLNCVNNETWLHEGYITWKDAEFDTLSLSLIPRVTSVEAASGTNYNLYGGYLVIPAAPGTGTINITSDITTHSGGLVYMPDDDLGTAPLAYWDADWNTSTKQYENITPAYAANGRYNMFAAEITLAKFVREIPLLSSGFIALNSSDTDEVGHGMRLKMTSVTNPSVPDHDWSVACILCVHRERSS
jgi:hypothetical protein